MRKKMNTFSIDQQVVCVDNDMHNELFNAFFIKEDSGLDGLRIGEMYTIRWIGIQEGPHIKEKSMLCLKVKEIIRPLTRLGVESGYGVWRFRPLVERKTDISIFT